LGPDFAFISFNKCALAPPPESVHQAQVVSEAVFERLNESIRRQQELLERLQRENKLLRELRRLELLEK
jgi:hypothetical protein